mmetsp:Transcript_45304/g.98116  ORF Transcript_45304/g.98116 Transcript_45304/m.98116 type:complete len:336 (-) Transcript_45304:350-1357(-)
MPLCKSLSSTTASPPTSAACRPSLPWPLSPPSSTRHKTQTSSRGSTPSLQHVSSSGSTGSTSPRTIPQRLAFAPCPVRRPSLCATMSTRCSRRQPSRPPTWFDLCVSSSSSRSNVVTASPPSATPSLNPPSLAPCGSSSGSRRVSLGSIVSWVRASCRVTVSSPPFLSSQRHPPRCVRRCLPGTWLRWRRLWKPWADNPRSRELSQPSSSTRCISSTCSRAVSLCIPTLCGAGSPPPPLSKASSPSERYTSWVSSPEPLNVSTSERLQLLRRRRLLSLSPSAPRRKTSPSPPSWLTSSLLLSAPRRMVTAPSSVACAPPPRRSLARTSPPWPRTR